MFKKSLLAAALLVAGGTAANAAEIGVRNTTGYNTRTITGGTSSYVRNVTGQYSEDSAGFALGVVADDFTAGEYSFAEGYSDVAGEFTGDFGHSSATGSVEIPAGRRTGLALGGSAPVNLQLNGGIDGEFSGTAEGFEESESGYFVDGSLSVSGSGYVRHESGTISEDLTETYNFGGSSRSDFSELSTFSR